MIRKATAQDIPLIKSMAEIVFKTTYKDILSPEQMEYMMEMMYSSDSLCRQMTEEGHIFLLLDDIAYVSYRFDRKEELCEIYHLEKLYVLPAFQGRGIGRKMFDTVVSEIFSVARAPFKIELNVNRHNPAVAFYERIGMHKDRQGDFPIGNGFYMNDYIMVTKPFSI